MTDYVYTSGGFPSAPTSGDSLFRNGAFYDWTGGAWKIRRAVPLRSEFIATANQATVTGLTYFTGSIDCYINGAKMLLGTDFTATDGTSVTFTPALDLDDEVQLIMGVSASSGAATGGVTVYADLAALVAVTPSTGDMALVQDINKMFVYTGTGWFLIATVTNGTPSAISGVAGAYDLALDGTATVITAASTDPEGFPLTWSYSVTTGSLGSTATVTQADNVFTITPSTDAANAGTFGITFSVTDGATGLVTSASTFALNFVQGFLDFSLPAANITIANYSDILASFGSNTGTPSWVFNGTQLVFQQSGAYDAGFYRPFDCTNGTTYTFTMNIATFPSGKRTTFEVLNDAPGVGSSTELSPEITASGASSRTWTANFTGTAYIRWRTVTTNTSGTYYINSLDISPWE